MIDLKGEAPNGTDLVHLVYVPKRSIHDRFKRESSYLRHLLRFGSSQFHLPSIDPLYRRQATLPLGNFPCDGVLACVMGMVMRTVRRENVVATHDIVNHRVTPTA